MAVLDTALARYRFCDPDRVGMLGGSYGGYMATMLAGRFSDRFRAICSERAVNNLISEEWSSDIATAFRVDHGPTHIEDPDEYARMSPIRYVRDIDVPMLILHSENDLRCPIVQAEELFIALRLLGKDVTFYRFPVGEPRALPLGLARPPPRCAARSSSTSSRRPCSPVAAPAPRGADEPGSRGPPARRLGLRCVRATASDAGAVATARDPGRSSVPSRGEVYVAEEPS